MINGFNRKDLKAFVRIDGMGRVVAGSLILRKSKPKLGRWQEIAAYACCGPTTTVAPSTTTTTSVPGPPPVPTTTTTTSLVLFSN